jgi:cyclopropane-fatty-acyl-phospholipid synthase
LRKGFLLKRALPLLLTRGSKLRLGHEYAEDETGRGPSRRDETDFIQFHYDAGNDFYALFLDPEMQYSCAYFTGWENSLEQAQRDKLDMICRKLRLQPSERFLDIGSGWGGLLCHAAENYDVTAHGVTLSQAQYDYTRDKLRRLGLEDRVTVELRSYEGLEGEYDKIASIGMYEHVGIANYPAYFGKLNSLLRDRGLLLNHGITRRAKRSRRKFRKVRPENRLILKYIFPGSELDHIGHSLEVMEAGGFEIHDVECWREHYALTCRLWHRRLVANKEAAIAQVGPERYRMWIAYLAGVSFAFADGSLRIYQTVASKHKAKGLSGLPPTREDLYG